MIQRLTKVGDKHALMLDAQTLELVGLREADRVDVRIQGDSIVLTPVAQFVDDDRFGQTMEKVLNQRRNLLKRLA